jgi:pimeloyl-ACP methyl ester carboxylesterase
VAHSMGGRTASVFSMRNPERVSALVLSGTNGGSDRTNADTRSGFPIENIDAVRPPMEWATIAVLSIPIWSSSPSKSSAKAALPLGSGSSGVLPKVR